MVVTMVGILVIVVTLVAVLFGLATFLHRVWNRQIDIIYRGVE